MQHGCSAKPLYKYLQSGWEKTKQSQEMKADIPFLRLCCPMLFADTTEPKFPICWLRVVKG